MTWSFWAKLIKSIWRTQRACSNDYKTRVWRLTRRSVTSSGIEFSSEIDREGLNKTQRIEAVVSAPRAVNVSQLHSFLGLVNYYNRFLPNVSIVLHPLHQLLGESREWQWSERCELAFTEAKGMITSEQVLMRYDPALPVRLACDASPTGIGALLSPVNPCGSERPVAFASWSLTKTEHKYAQID